MEIYLILHLLFCIFYATSSDNTLHKLLFNYVELNSCENKTVTHGNCSDNTMHLKESKNASKTLLLTVYNNDYSIPLNEYDVSLFASNAKVNVQEAKSAWTVPIENFRDMPIYEGIDANGTYACGFVIDSVFNGFLMLSNGSSIYIESIQEYSNSYFNDTKVVVAYRASDVIFGDCSSLNDSSCREGIGFSESLNCIRETKRKISCFLNPNELKTDPWPLFTSDHISITPTKKPPMYPTNNATCRILISGDATYYELYNYDLESALYELVLVFKQVNRILNFIDFNGDGQSEGFFLQIGGVNLKLKSNKTGNFSIHDKGILSKLTEDFRKLPQDDCMALMFVSVPTDSNWVSTSYGGGICKNNENESEPARNVAIINVMDSLGNTRPVFSTAWTVAMALGQVMGSAERNCESISPFPPEEDWTSFFSDCGRHNIANVLERQGSCLEFPKGVTKYISKPTLEPEEVKVMQSACGNGRVDSTEECDCGTVEECKKSFSCCVPPGKPKECQYDRSKGYQCDWKDTCCTRDCKIVPKNWDSFCGKGEASCALKEAYCDGKSPYCPVSRSSSSLKDGEQCGPATLKQLGAGTCKRGHCNSTVCQDAGLRNCACAPLTGHQCRVCCKLSNAPPKGKKENDPSLCVPAEYFGLKPKKGRLFYRYQGTPCSDVGSFGHCDKYGKCVQYQTAASCATTTFNELHHYFVAASIPVLILIYFY